MILLKNKKKEKTGYKDCYVLISSVPVSVAFKIFMIWL